MAQTPDWTIPAGGERCAGCDKDLAPGERVVVSFRLDAEGPQREDRCASCGESVDKSDAIFWVTTLPEDAGRRPLVDYGVLREIFSALLARDEPLHRRLAYLVGLVLVRKRHLRLIGFEAAGPGREVMVVNHGAGTPRVEVPAPILSSEDIEELRERLADLLRADLSSLEIEVPERPAD